MWFYYYDSTYFAYMIPALVLLLISQGLVSSRFSKYSKVRNYRGLTGRDAALAVLRENGIHNVGIERVSGKLSDHYDPRAKVIRLSDSVYESRSVAAVGVAAHEAGHAVQHASGYSPLKIRNAIIPVCNIGSTLSVPIIILGFVLNSGLFVNLGLLLFALVVVFQLITLPVEFNASRRALQCIEQTGMLSDEEYTGARKVLSAAALTYVASMLQSLLLLLYYYQRFAGRKR